MKDDSTDSTKSGENDSTASESDSESGDSADTDSNSEDADSKTTTVINSLSFMLVMRQEMAADM